MEKIYLDNNATTQLDPQVLEAMYLELKGPGANPSSAHTFGQRARNLLAEARAKVASFCHAKPEEIIFTSGATEGINQFLRGLGTRGHIITTAIEHASVYKTVQALESQGLEVTYIPVDLFGAPKPDLIEAAIRANTRAIVLSAANSETGVKIDLAAIDKIAAKHGLLFFIDAVAYIGKEVFQMPPHCSSLVMAAHKFHGPKGTGVLFIRSGVKIPPLLTGGNQEHMHRAGTSSLAGIIGLAEALQMVHQEQEAITAHMTRLRDTFEKGLQQQLPNIVIHGQGPRVSNTSSIAFLGLEGETLQIQLDMAGIATGFGSACVSGGREPSRALINMGIDRKTALATLRFSFSRMNTLQEIETAVERIVRIVNF